MDSGSGTKSQEACELFTITTDVDGKAARAGAPGPLAHALGKVKGAGSHESESRTLVFRNEQPVFQIGRIVVLI